VCNQCRNPLHHNTCSPQATLLLAALTLYWTLQQMRDQCWTHCTNSITNPVIENNKQIANQQDQKGLQNASTQNRRSGVEDLALVHNQSSKNLTSRMLQRFTFLEVSWFERLCKNDDRTKRGNISLRKSQGMLFESLCFDWSESDDSHSFKYPKSVLKTA